MHAEDNDYLYQADVTVCYMENGRAKVEHYLMEVAGGPLIPHTEVGSMFLSDIFIEI